MNSEAQPGQEQRMELHIVFDGPPGHEAGRFVECETPDGRSVNAGEWHERDDGFWELRLNQPVTRSTADLGEDGERAVALATKRIEGKAHGYVTLAVADVRALLGAVLSRSGH